MFNGNLYGLIITVLTFVIAIVLTMQQVEHTGVHVELTIRPVSGPSADQGVREARRPSSPKSAPMSNRGDAGAPAQTTIETAIAKAPGE